MSCSPGSTTFVGVLDQQRDNIIASIQQLNRLAGTFAGQRDVIDRALKEIPPALDVLIRERPNLTTALERLGTFSDTATELVNDAGDDLVTNLRNLEPALKALADIGPDLAPGLMWATAFPYGPAFADRITRGDYINLYRRFRHHLSATEADAFPRHPVGRRRREIHSGAGRPVVPELLVRSARCASRAATAGCASPAEPLPADALPPPPEGAMPPVTEPLVPMVPPANAAPVSTSSLPFAGPYAADASAPPAPAVPPDPGALPAVPPTPGGGG